MTRPPARRPSAQGLYDPSQEHDACGVGFVVNIKGVRSHKLVEQAFEVAVNLLHRGACGCERNTGDGAGLLLQVPDKFLRRETAALGFRLPPAGEYGVGMLFLPRPANEQIRVEERVVRIVLEEGQHVLGWREVPTDDSALGETARQGEPAIRQVFIGRGADFGDGPDARARFERKLYVVRKRIAREVNELGLEEADLFYIASLSSQTIVYKGMLIADQVKDYFPDMVDERFESAIALVHS
ncbi:MAG: hypothetical protein QF681_12300, partial [Vicinamibacterales bacterium]|nr:hypothetical protein [Vicinamibacterales bacterium]